MEKEVSMWLTYLVILISIEKAGVVTERTVDISCV